MDSQEANEIKNNYFYTAKILGRAILPPPVSPPILGGDTRVVINASFYLFSLDASESWMSKVPMTLCFATDLGQMCMHSIAGDIPYKFHFAKSQRGSFLIDGDGSCGLHSRLLFFLI